MANRDELTELLQQRLRHVPNLTEEDIVGWINRSYMEHGYRLEQEVPDRQVLLVLLYAEWDACVSIAFQSAHFFEYKDGEESVDKRAVSEQYRRLAAELKKRYETKKAELNSTEGPGAFYIATRADRP